MGTHKVRVYPGAGKPIEIDQETAAAEKGSVGDVIPRILRETVRDPSLLRMLGNPNLVYEQASPVESPIEQDRDWREIVNDLQKQDVEIGMAVAHRGGGER